MTEFDLIDIIRARCAATRADVRLGIGDDAAVLVPPPGHDLVVSTDTLIAGVHFPMTTGIRDLGWKSLAVNLSDLAAMGATPAWALLALTLPAADRSFVEEFSDGFAELAAQYSVALVGGDTTQGPLTVTVVVHGFVAANSALRRDGARVGDGVYVTGALGDAAAGLGCLDANAVRMSECSYTPEVRAHLIARLMRPTPRVAAGMALRGRASACIDVSDGLLADLGHIAACSGVGIEVDAATLPASSALLALFDGDERIALQASGGDDYELAFTMPSTHAENMQGDIARIGCGATRIGRVVAEPGVRLIDASGAQIVLRQPGWQHFA
ncbi:MAG: thiamine-phosphate kinase [Rhodanobacter sp.]|jgi:thiamine-monophosphate kinase|nr:thiamine-phosphate kinase [Rhodanobacter sp.]